MYLKRIKTLVEKNHLEFKALAEDIGMSEGNLHRCVRENRIQAQDLEKIANVLNVPIGYFFDEKEPAPTIVEAVDHSIAANNSDITIGDYHSLKKENSMLEKLIDEKDERIKELKERIEELKSK